MNNEFHYWITAVIAESAGFTPAEAGTIAYSSQFVDDNDSEITVYADELSPEISYENEVSQTMDILLPRKDLMHIYPLFHFIPGDQASAAKRKDRKTHPLNTTPGSSHARLIFQEALASCKGEDQTGLHRLGIATHAFADTWAHQNFAGCWDDFNDMGNVAIPDVGHADAVHHPDWVSHRWNDDRLIESNVSNNTRYLAAANAIYRGYTGLLVGEGRGATRTWESLEAELLRIWGGTYSGNDEKGADDRVKGYGALVDIDHYDDRKWQFGALETKIVPKDGADDYVERYFWKSGVNRQDTDWYKFQEAVKAHIASSKEILKNVFALAGIAV